MRSVSSLGAILLLAACGGGAMAGSDAGMAYGVPAESPLTYVRGDSLRATVEIPGMGEMGISFNQAMTLGVTYAPSAGGAELTASFEDYNATLDNPVAGTSRASESSIDGAMVFTLDAQGRANLTTRPTVSGNASQILRVASVANELLPRMPGRPVSAGDSWADTIQYSENTPAGNLEVMWSTTFTVVGTESWNGREVTRVTSSGSYSMSSGGQMQGMYVEQSLGGPETGYFLWDANDRVVVYFESERSLDGTVDADAAPAPMSMTARSLVKTTLQN